eukprot:scaffold1085_cov407-Prasinococcus_capsulatus_cf.AAC.41
MEVASGVQRGRTTDRCTSTEAPSQLAMGHMGRRACTSTVLAPRSIRVGRAHAAFAQTRFPSAACTQHCFNIAGASGALLKVRASREQLDAERGPRHPVKAHPKGYALARYT